MIQTAETFLKENFEGGTINPSILIEFAKLHCIEQARVISEKAYIEYIDLETKEIFDYTDVLTDDNIGADINKESILNAYPLDLIK